MSTKAFNRKKRELRLLASRVNQLILSGEWIKLSAASRHRFIIRLNLLSKQLSAYLSYTELKKILAAAAIFIGFPLVANSQSFAPPLKNPFWLTTDSVSLASPKLADIDNDGDFDLFEGKYGGFIQFFENIGTSVNPVFGPAQQNPFGIVTPNSEYYISFPAFADLDNDGDLDLLIGGIYGAQYNVADFKYYENTGTGSSPAFAAPQTNPFGIEPGFMFAVPEFADIDNDGDLDLFTCEGYGNFKFRENTGSAAEPEFAAPVTNPFGLTAAYNLGSPAFADIDHDGDLDLFSGQLYGEMIFFENTGTKTTPAFAPVQTNPFGLVPTNYYNFPAIADLDEDGDVDILVGEYYSVLQYFRNTEFNTGVPENGENTIFSLYPNPASTEVFVNIPENIKSNRLNYNVLDQTGRVVLDGELTSPDNKIVVNNLVPGVYFIMFLNDEKPVTRKLIVQ
jgi:hypothetical protein